MSETVEPSVEPDIEVVSVRTEARHVVHATVKDAEPIPVEVRRQMRPEQIIVTYRWCVQDGHTGWHLAEIELVGPRLPLPPDAGLVSSRSARIMDNRPTTRFFGEHDAFCAVEEAPEWAVTFARHNRPCHALGEAS